jgi:hypothetical protein
MAYRMIFIGASVCICLIAAKLVWYAKSFVDAKKEDRQINFHILQLTIDVSEE